MNKQQLTPHQVKQLIDYLFSYQMTNYGYTARDYSRIFAQRRRAKSAVAQLMITDKERLLRNIQREYENNSGLYFAKDKPHYDVGLSPNEEITNILRRFADPSAKYAS